MTLSQAIRKGCEIGPQVRGHYTALVDGKRGYCAIGASLAAIGALELPVPFWVPGGKPAIAHEAWRDIVETKCSCPAVCGQLLYAKLDHLMSHLNDYHGWTRERIADWVESVERVNAESAFLQKVKAVASQPVEPETVAG